jgi:hypothetical protein
VHYFVKSHVGEMLSDSEVWYAYSTTDALIEGMDLGRKWSSF